MKRKKYLNLLLNPLKIEIISIALKLKVFDLFEESLSIKELEKKLGFTKHNTKVFLDALVHLKLLKYKESSYKNSSFSKKYFVSFSEDYIADVFLYRQEYFQLDQKNILKLLKGENKEKMELQNQKQWVKVSKKYFFQEQKALLSAFIINIVKKLTKTNKINKILDLGCNSGVVSLELLKANTDFQAVLFDFEEVIKQTKKNIKKYKMEKRVTTLYGDIQKDDIKQGYDLVICSNILHLLPQQKQVLQKIYKALNKNGILLIIQSNILDDSTQNINSYFYNLIPILYDETHIKNYPSTEMLIDTGFQSVDSFISDKTTSLQSKVYIAKK